MRCDVRVCIQSGCCTTGTALSARWRVRTCPSPESYRRKRRNGSRKRRCSVWKISRKGQLSLNNNTGNNNNNRIYIAPYGRNFRGAGGRSDQCSVLSLDLKTDRYLCLGSVSGLKHFHYVSVSFRLDQIRNVLARLMSRYLCLGQCLCLTKMS